VTPWAATWSEGAFELPLAFALMYREEGIASSGEYLIELLGGRAGMSRQLVTGLEFTYLQFEPA
jgi:hypothetical protein